MAIKNHPRRNEAIDALARVIVEEELADAVWPDPGASRAAAAVVREDQDKVQAQLLDAVRPRVASWYDTLAAVLDAPDEPGDGARRYLESMYPDGVYPDYEDEGPYPGRGDR